MAEFGVRLITFIAGLVFGILTWALFLTAVDSQRYKKEMLDIEVYRSEKPFNCLPPPDVALDMETWRPSVRECAFWRGERERRRPWLYNRERYMPRKKRIDSTE